MMQFLSFDFLKFFLPLLGAAFAWYWNERQKRATDEYVRKEKRYEALIETLRGFYEGTSEKPEGSELRAGFLTELNKAWLYCPDSVIKKAYAFLATIETSAKTADGDRRIALGELMIEIRTDLLSRRLLKRTRLGASDFKHIKST
jgi:hypothetical protein